MRQNYFILVVGDKGTGKTTFTKKELLPTIGKKKLIFDIEDHPDWRDYSTIAENDLKRWRNGDCRIISGEPSKTIDTISKSVRNSVIVFEDARQYFNSNLSKQAENIIIQSKQKNNDVIAMYHSLGQVPKYFTEIYNAIVLFKTKDSRANVRRYETNRSEIENAIDFLRKTKNQYEKIVIEA